MIRPLILLSLLLVACPPLPAPIPPTPDADAAQPIVVPPVPEAGADEPTDVVDEAKRQTAMGKACAQLAALGCPEGKPTPLGETCEKVYTDVATFPGLSGSFNTACVSAAKTVDEVRSKCKVKCGR